MSSVLPLPASVALRGRQVPVLVVEELGELDQPARLSLERLLADAEHLDRRCREALLAPPSGSDEHATELYVSHHHEQMALPADIAGGGIEAFVRAMDVRSIWITADADGELLHVDYSIDPKGTQYVLSVALSRDGAIRSVRMES